MGGWMGADEKANKLEDDERPPLPLLPQVTLPQGGKASGTRGSHWPEQWHSGATRLPGLLPTQERVKVEPRALSRTPNQRAGGDCTNFKALICCAPRLRSGHTAAAGLCPLFSPPQRFPGHVRLAGQSGKVRGG